MGVCGSRNSSGGAPWKEKEEKEMFTLANDRKHTKPVLLFQDVLSKDV